MSSIKTTQIDGDVSVGRNVAMGGKLTVAGSVTIGHNLKVDGWLDAPNIKGANKGIFLTVDDLREAYPSPQDGWMAGVGSSSPFAVYIGKGGEWVATGGTMEINVDMAQYTKDMEQIQQDITAANNNISTEAAERKAADNTLQTNIDAETLARQTADAELQTNIDAFTQSLSEGNIRFVSFSDLDTVLGTNPKEVREAIQLANGKHTLKYIVTSNDSGSGDVFVGYVDMFADGLMHCLTQEFTTNYLIDADGKLDGNTHNHKLHKYVRYYAIVANGADWRGEAWAQGTWTKWNSPVEDVEASVKEMQTNIDDEVSARKSADETLQGSITTIKNSIGKASGIAPLNEDGKISSEYLTSESKSVLAFNDFVSGVTLQSYSITSWDEIDYDTERNTFLAMKDGRYFANWLTRENYCAEMGGEPYTEKIYTDGVSTYYYDGETLVCIGADNTTSVDTLTASLKTEVANRQNEDVKLATSITNETTERKQKDEALQASITEINGKFLHMTESEYEALSTYDDSTYYMLTEE